MILLEDFIMRLDKDEEIIRFGKYMDKGGCLILFYSKKKKNYGSEGERTMDGLIVTSQLGHGSNTM